MPWLWRERFNPGADALKQTLKAITYVICMMQHNASELTWYAVHQQVADALKQTLKAITYVICMMQHNASELTWYAVHQQVSPNCPMSQ